MPIYNFTYSKREDRTQTVKPANVLIFEGILSFYDDVQKVLIIENSRLNGFVNIRRYR